MMQKKFPELTSRCDVRKILRVWIEKLHGTNKILTFSLFLNYLWKNVF